MGREWGAQREGVKRGGWGEKRDVVVDFIDRNLISHK